MITTPCVSDAGEAFATKGLTRSGHTHAIRLFLMFKQHRKPLLHLLKLSLLKIYIFIHHDKNILINRHYF